MVVFNLSTLPTKFSPSHTTMTSPLHQNETLAAALELAHRDLLQGLSPFHIMSLPMFWCK